MGFKTMILGRQPYTVDRLVRLALSGAAFVGAIYILAYLSDVLVPFAIALLLAYLVNPLVTIVQNKIGNRVAAVILTLLCVLAVFVGVCWILIPMIAHEVAAAAKLLSDFFTDSKLASEAKERLPEDVWVWIQDQASKTKVRDFLKSDKFFSLMQESLAKVMPLGKSLLGGLSSVFVALVAVVVIAMYLVFLLIDYNRVRGEMWDLLPEDQRASILSFFQDVDREMNRYFRAQFTIAMLVGIGHAVGFAIIGLPMGIVLGLLVGLLNMVPYLQLIAFIPALLLAVLHALQVDQSFFWVLAQVLLVFGVMQAMQDWFLIPKIMGDATGLSPALILLSLSVWGKLLGFLGLLIAIPMTCLCLAYYRRFLDQYRGDGAGGGGKTTPHTLATGAFHIDPIPKEPPQP